MSGRPESMLKMHILGTYHVNEMEGSIHGKDTSQRSIGSILEDDPHVTRAENDDFKLLQLRVAGLG